MAVANAGGVILLHGLGRTAGSMRPPEKALQRAGYATLRIDYPARRKGLADLVDSIHPAVEAFVAGVDGPLHFVTHSLGGLLARAYIARHRPPSLGRVVMLAPPNGGSEFADILQTIRLSRLVLGPVAQHLVTRRAADDETLLGAIDYPVGVIAGDRPLDPLLPRLVVRRPNDGKVAIEATRLDGMTDHIVLPVTHSFMTYNPILAAQMIAFLRDGSFRR